MKFVLLMATALTFSTAFAQQLPTAESVSRKLGNAENNLRQTQVSLNELNRELDNVRQNLARLNDQARSGGAIDPTLVMNANRAMSYAADKVIDVNASVNKVTQNVASARNDMTSSRPETRHICFALDAKGNIGVGEGSTQQAADSISTSAMRYALVERGCSERPQVLVDLRVQATGSLNGVQCTVVSGKSRVFRATAPSEADALIQAFRSCGDECGKYRLNSKTCVNL